MMLVRDAVQALSSGDMGSFFDKVTGLRWSLPDRATPDFSPCPDAPDLSPLFGDGPDIARRIMEGISSGSSGIPDVSGIPFLKGGGFGGQLEEIAGAPTRTR